MIGEIRNNELEGTGWISSVGGRRQAVIPGRNHKQDDPVCSGIKERYSLFESLDAKCRIKAILYE